MPEQSIDALAGQRNDLVGGALAIGDVGVVAQIDEGKRWESAAPTHARW